ncbi:MAG: LytR C-terminal domain-containing protein [candidate division WOR-3 bacterium]
MKKKNIKIEKESKKIQFKFDIRKFSINLNFRKILIYLGVFIIFGFVLLFSMSTYISFSKRKIELMKRNLFPQIKIEIYNGSGYDGVARKLTWYLRDNGFDVIYYGNSSEEISKTIIVDRIDSSMKYAKILRDFLGGGIMKFEIDPDKLTTITILIGKDFYNILPKIKDYEKVF